MDYTKQMIENNLRSNLGYFLIQWVKNVHEKKKGRDSGSARNNVQNNSAYTDLMSLKTIGNERIERKFGFR
jgi:hypothetical protein